MLVHRIWRVVGDVVRVRTAVGVGAVGVESILQGKEFHTKRSNVFKSV